ncbi:N-acetyltransferase [uncultured Bacteroides sp.]|uniref:N-acetyltransferase n=1 Tax=uncultured Bacteroides sp. TaxID=162156 RepID=UPI002AAAAFBB|nr:N-acetyltransferase [uncultured Bacteroides sp.]
MAVIVKQVSNKKELKEFIRFNIKLYKGNAYSVPDLYDDMLNTFNKDKNPAFEFCEAEYFLAYKDDKIVGRIAAIINHKANQTWNKKDVRFGWIDFIDDLEVSEALLKVVENYGKEHGMENIQGPLGFTDFDAEGMLIEGFDQLSTMATIYNYPYYPEHMQKLGYGKDADWVEFKIYIPETGVPEKHQRISDLIQRKYNLRVIKYTSGKKLAKDYGQAIFDLMNEAYSPLYGYSALSQKQIEHYMKIYLPVVDLKMVPLVVDQEGKLIAAGITMPSLSVALQKANGRLLPFGWFHLIKALFFGKRKVIDLLLIAVKPEYQNKGVNALLFSDLIPVYQKEGCIFAESNPELELNGKVQAQWEYFETVQHKRRRAFIKKIDL